MRCTSRCLTEAAQIADRVERAICERREVAAVQTHLEPLERTLVARPADVSADKHAEREIERLVRDRAVGRLSEVKLLSSDAGRVVFVTLTLDAEEPLTAAHQLASELEEEMRLRIPGIADVVIRTEP
jgi:divalent metal cation (Fe/Co/Zn/Cd) transporter